MSDALLDPTAVAAQLGLAPVTLYQWKYRGVGPRHIKVGGRLRYRQTDVDAWLDEQAQRAS